MSRATLALDRVVLLVLGVLVVVVSAFLLVWGLDRWPAAPEQVDLAALRRVPEQPWWPWALGVGGVLAVVLAVRSLLAHARHRRVHGVTLRPPPDAPAPPGRLRVDLPAVATAAAARLATAPVVEAARGHVVVDRGSTVVELVARVDASADLDRVRAAVDRTREELAVVLPPRTAQLRVRLDVRRSRVEKARVS